MISSDGFHSLEDSVVTYQQHLETRSNEAFQNEPVNYNTPRKLDQKIVANKIE